MNFLPRLIARFIGSWRRPPRCRQGVPVGFEIFTPAHIALQKRHKDLDWEEQYSPILFVSPPCPEVDTDGHPFNYEEKRQAYGLPLPENKDPEGLGL